MRTSILMLVLGLGLSTFACAGTPGAATADGGAPKGSQSGGEARETEEEGAPGATEDGYPTGTNSNGGGPTSPSPTAADGGAAASDAGPSAADGGTRVADSGPVTVPVPDTTPPPSKGTCANPTTCATARKTSLASLSGDVDLVPYSVLGSTSEFIQLRITEDSSYWHDMKVKATLTSPPGMNFDLLMYVPSEDTANTCKLGEAELSAKSSGDDVLTRTWSDGFGDDSRTVVFEVRHVSGTCTTAANARWTLTIEGDKE